MSKGAGGKRNRDGQEDEELKHPGTHTRAEGAHRHLNTGNETERYRPDANKVRVSVLGERPKRSRNHIPERRASRGPAHARRRARDAHDISGGGGWISVVA